MSDLSTDLKYELLGIALATLGIIGIVSLVGLNTGPVGKFVAKVLRYGFGIGAIFIPCVVLIIGSRYVWTHKAIEYSAKFWGITFSFLLGLAIYHHYKVPEGQEILPESLLAAGGLAGGLILFVLRKFLGPVGSIIMLFGLTACAIIMSTAWSVSRTMQKAKEKAMAGFYSARETLATAKDEDYRADNPRQSYSPAFYDQERDRRNNITLTDITDNVPQPVAPSEQQPKEPELLPSVSPGKREYKLPPLTILHKSNKLRLAKLPREITENARLLEQTLNDFGIGAKVINTCQGPTVTRYELEPAPGVKVSRIVALADDIALKLAAPGGIRIEAPIPGKAAIGIEVPNKEVASVPLRDVLESQEFKTAQSRLTVGLGKDIAGQVIVADLAKMPHLLVAGATGSGKSVCINTIIASILFKATPEEVKFILIDPKMVELSNYNGIPHLMTPVVNDVKKAASALRWAVQEMERRYNLFAAAGVRDIGRYNEIMSDDKLPLIVIIIDELADLMMVAPVDVEDAICRLAQMARAAGLHLVLATQRPSVDVITGTIKANIPSRISFAVSSQVDSRTILDMAGAEKLLGKGDMLFNLVGAAKPMRVQGAFIADDEVEALVNYLKGQAQPEYSEEITSVTEENIAAGERFTDELLEDAIRMVLETGQASASMLQRKFRIGYTRAARLIDTMEEMKIVGPNLGSKPREILMTSEQVYARYFNNQS